MHSGVIIQYARDWVGVPFQHQGRTRHGVDCVGFVIAIMKELDVLPHWFKDIRDYARRPNVDLVEIVGTYCEPIQIIEPACLSLMRWLPSEPPSHVGLLTGKTIIHAYQRIGKVVEHDYTGRWPKYQHSLWRLPGVTP